MKPVDVKSNTYIDSSKEINEKDLNFFFFFKSLKLMTLLQNQNTKIFLLKVAIKIGLKKFLMLKKLKYVPWTYVTNDMNSYNNLL